MCECCNQYQCLGSDTGVFHVGELCDLLRAENMYDVCALALRPELGYVDHMVIASGISKRHLRAVAMKINQVVSAAFIRVRVTASILHKYLNVMLTVEGICSCTCLYVQYKRKRSARDKPTLHMEGYADRVVDEWLAIDMGKLSQIYYIILASNAAYESKIRSKTILQMFEQLN